MDLWRVWLLEITDPFGESSTSTTPRIICQTCGKDGHPTVDCFQSMNMAYEGRIQVQHLTSMALSPSTITHQTNGSQLLKTSANAHITPYLQNILNPKKYNGNEKVGGVGNASTLQISHFGSTTVNIDSCKFSLNDILHCPTPSTNLISIHRFTSDNHCYILIFPDRFVVKDLKTRKAFFQRRCDNGLYPFHSGWWHLQ